LVQNGSNHFPGSSQQVHGFATDVITGSAVVAAASAAKQWHSCLGHLEAFRSSYMQLRVGLSYDPGPVVQQYLSASGSYFS